MSQIHVTVEPELKKQLENMAKNLGVSVSSLTRSVLTHLAHTKQVSFPLEKDSVEKESNQLKQEMIESGYETHYAETHKKAYTSMLQAEQSNKLTQW